MPDKEWRIFNASGKHRIIVTKNLPGNRWLDILLRADCRVEIFTSTDILPATDIKNAVGDRCDGAIGQLTEDWNEEVISALKVTGCRIYSNYAVGYNNVDVEAATRYSIPVGNTPGVLTETTAELAVALTFAAARRIVEADTFMRNGRFKGWLPTLYLGELLYRKTVGVIGAGRIGSTYARMMVEGFKMDLIYHDIHENRELEDHVSAYSEFLMSLGEKPVTCAYADTIKTVLQQADVISLHPVLNESTHHMIDRERLNLMKKNAILVNASRGPIIDEAALVSHCKKNPDFRVGLDVYENEPAMSTGLEKLDNVVVVPHLGSATRWTREGMAILAAHNVAAILNGYPVWKDTQNIYPFLEDNPPRAAPSIVNASELKLPAY